MPWSWTSQVSELWGKSLLCIRLWYVVVIFIHSFNHVWNSLWPHGLQHTRLSCPSPSLRACSNSCPLSWWCHLILCHPLLLLPSIFPNIRVFFNESALHVRWPKYWSFSFSISLSNEYSVLIPLVLTGLILLSKGLSRVFSNTTVQKHQFFCAQPPLWSNSHIHTWLAGKTITHSFDYTDLCQQSNVSAF